jgi:hypothetical protein
MSSRIPTLALLVAAALLAGCGGSAPSGSTTADTSAPSTTAPASTTSKEGEGEGTYPEAAREAFLDSCEGGSTPETCECALRYLEENVSIEDFVEAGIAISQGEPPPDVITKADESCQ